MLVSARTRRVFRQQAVNDNVPAAQRRLAGLATLLAILATSVALVLVHSVVAWWQPGWRNATALVRPAGAQDLGRNGLDRNGLGRHALRHLAAAQEAGVPRPSR